jgi:hypothetical protein
MWDFPPGGRVRLANRRVVRRAAAAAVRSALAQRRTSSTRIATSGKPSGAIASPAPWRLTAV